LSIRAVTRTKTRWGVKDKIFDDDVTSGTWQYSRACDLGDFDEALIIVLNDGVSGFYFRIEACADINDADWYRFYSGALSSNGYLGAGSGTFETLQNPWGAVRVGIQGKGGVTHGTVWVNTRLRT